MLNHFSKIVFGALLISSLNAPAGAQSKSELKQIEKKLTQERKSLEETLSKKASVLDVLDDIERNMSDLSTSLRRMRTELSTIQIEIQKIQSQVLEKEKNLERTRDQSQKRLVTLYKMGEMGGLKILFSAHSFSDLVRRTYQLNFVLKDDISLIQRFNVELSELTLTRRALEIEREKRTKKERELNEKDEELQSQLRQKKNLFSTIANEEQVRRRYIQELEEARGRLEKLLTRLSSKDAAQKPQSPSGKSFLEEKGKLPAPVKGRVVKKFGKYQDPKFFTHQFHKGVDIAAKPGSEVRAIYEGTVVFAGWFKGYGQMVILDHGDGFHTLAANNSEVLRGVGEVAKQGEALGRLGEGDAGSNLLESMLYFEVRQRGQSVDPLEYLRSGELR